MINMEVKFKRISDKAIMPIRAHKGDAGVDLTATQITTEIEAVEKVINDNIEASYKTFSG